MTDLCQWVSIIVLGLLVLVTMLEVKDLREWLVEWEEGRDDE